MSNACNAGMRIGRTEETAVGRSNACNAGMRIGRTGRKPCGRYALYERCLQRRHANRQNWKEAVRAGREVSSV